MPATERPPHVKPPAHWQPSLPPAPAAAAPEPDPDHALSPTRYGDWELKGRAVDF